MSIAFWQLLSVKILENSMSPAQNSIAANAGRAAQSLLVRRTNLKQPFAALNKDW
jgi:hypothetical protein